MLTPFWAIFLWFMNFLPQCLALFQQIPAQQSTFENNFHFCYSHWLEISGKFHLNLQEDLGQDKQKNICQSSEHWVPRKCTGNLDAECRLFTEWWTLPCPSVLCSELSQEPSLSARVTASLPHSLLALAREKGEGQAIRAQKQLSPSSFPRKSKIPPSFLFCWNSS